jgi:hypothetical protein
MFLFSLWLYLLLKLVRELIKLALIFVAYPWSFWIDVGILVTSLIAALSTGGVIVWRKCREDHLRLEYYIAKNPARVNDAIDEKEELEGNLRCGNLELIYFKIRNRSKLVLSDNITKRKGLRSSTVC